MIQESWRLQYAFRSQTFGTTTVTSILVESETDAFEHLQGQIINFWQINYELWLAKLYSPSGEVTDLVKEPASPEYPLTNPWHHAALEDSRFLTPVHVGEAIMEGAKKVELWETVLNAIAQGAVSHTRICAWFATSGPQGGWP